MKENEMGLLRGGQFRYLMNKQLNALCKKYSLRRADIDVIFFLKNNTSQNTASDIQRNLHINKGYVSQIVNGLCEKGYLTATPDTQDRRYMHYKVTEKTAEITEEHQRIWETLGTRIFEGISPEDREVFDRVMATVCENITAMSGEKKHTEATKKELEKEFICCS